MLRTYLYDSLNWWLLNRRISPTTDMLNQEFRLKYLETMEFQKFHMIFQVYQIRTFTQLFCDEIRAEEGYARTGLSIGSGAKKFTDNISNSIKLKKNKEIGVSD